MRRLALLLALATAVACASSGQTEVRETDRAITTTTIQGLTVGGVNANFDLRFIEDISPREDTLSIDPDLAWGVLPSVYQELNIPLTSINQEARLLGTTERAVQGELGTEPASRYFNCGRTMTGEIAERYQLVITALSQVDEVEGSPERTRIVTLVDAFANPRAAGSGSVRCGSTHRLESQIAERVREMVSGEGG